MKHQRVVTVILFLSLSISTVFTGCASTSNTQNANTNQTSTDDTNTDDADTDHTVGMIQSINTDDNQITIGVMDKKPDRTRDSSSEGSPDGKENEQPPEKPDDNNGQMPEKSDDNNSQPPEKPDGNSDQAPQEMNENSKTYTVSDQTVIKDKDGNVITLADLSENTFVEFTIDGDTLLTISVTDMGDRKGRKDDSDKNTSEGNTSDDNTAEDNASDEDSSESSGI